MKDAQLGQVLDESRTHELASAPWPGGGSPMADCLGLLWPGSDAAGIIQTVAPFPKLLKVFSEQTVVSSHREKWVGETRQSLSALQMGKLESSSDLVVRPREGEGTVPPQAPEHRGLAS